jgi:hypothetical protein
VAARLRDPGLRDIFLTSPHVQGIQERLR